MQEYLILYKNMKEILQVLSKKLLFSHLFPPAEWCKNLCFSRLSLRIPILYSIARQCQLFLPLMMGGKLKTKHDVFRKIDSESNTMSIINFLKEMSYKYLVLMKNIFGVDFKLILIKSSSLLLCNMLV